MSSAIRRARGPRTGPSSANTHATMRFPSSSMKNAMTSTVISCGAVNLAGNVSVPLAAW